jgi:hypothetical protein
MLPSPLADTKMFSFSCAPRRAAAACARQLSREAAASLPSEGTRLAPAAVVQPVGGVERRELAHAAGAELRREASAHAAAQPYSRTTRAARAAPAREATHLEDVLAPIADDAEVLAPRAAAASARGETRTFERGRCALRVRLRRAGGALRGPRRRTCEVATAMRLA